MTFIFEDKNISVRFFFESLEIIPEIILIDLVGYSYHQNEGEFFLYTITNHDIQIVHRIVEDLEKLGFQKRGK